MNTMSRILAVAVATLIGTSSSRSPHIVLADNSSSSSNLQGIKINHEKEGSISIHDSDAQLTLSDAYHYNNDKKISPSLKVNSLSLDLSESCHEELIHITMPNGSTKKMKNIITVPREALGGDSEISTAYWYGEDYTDGSTFNYIRGVDGSVHGSLIDMTAGTTSQLHVDSEGNPIAVTRLSEDFSDEEDVEAPEAPVLPNFEEQHLFPISNMRRKLTGNTDMAEVTDDSGTVLDIMVVWTEKAEANVGGIDNMKSRINLAIQETNTAYALSGIDLELNLVHSYKCSINEPDSITLNLLESLKKNRDVKAEREKYKADSVVLLVTSTSSCGLGYVNFRFGQSKSSSKKHFYSVVKIECATGNFSFGHEIGHNLGARHDRGQETFCGDQLNYNYGYRHPGKFRSMMSYGCGKGKCDIDSTSRCSRVQRFSGPKVRFNGLVAGDSKNNNVRQINKVKAIAASFYSRNGEDGGGGGEESGSPSGSQPSYLMACIILLLVTCTNTILFG